MNCLKSCIILFGLFVLSGSLMAQSTLQPQPLISPQVLPQISMTHLSATIDESTATANDVDVDIEAEVTAEIPMIIGLRVYDDVGGTLLYSKDGSGSTTLASFSFTALASESFSQAFYVECGAVIDGHYIAVIGCTVVIDG